ncbi:E3 ubiquitin-protein ligase EL5-like [Panicum virgatum]|uniref:E3 ubiquitin-protein ligase EL5-like n=1 Tax=Panicum virgatum TaxID=38727 RepID=UPI0019D5519E|nr:E3 ubiquitin-protein ligase EL5-like [Panicum virgatum]
MATFIPPEPAMWMNGGSYSKLMQVVSWRRGRGLERQPCGCGEFRRGGARGLAEVDIRALLPAASPYLHLHAGPPEGATCSVCLEEVRGGEMVRSLPGCRHVFHVGCIDPWLHSHVTCPLCRSDLSPRRRNTMAAVAGHYRRGPGCNWRASVRLGALATHARRQYQVIQ